MLLGVVVAGFISFTGFYYSLVNSAVPRPQDIKVYLVQNEVLVENKTISLSISRTLITVGQYLYATTEPIFNCSYLYRVVVALYNPAPEPVVYINYSAISLNTSILTVGEYAVHDVYDPVALSPDLPTSIPANSMVTLRLTIASKKNLLAPGNSVLALRVVLYRSDNSTSQVLIVLPR